MRIVSLQSGPVRQYGVEGAEDPLERPWTSAIVKEAVSGPVWLGHEGLAGDSQADRRHHGGRDKALLGYGAGHYPAWRVELAEPDLAPGAFGENLAIEGATEHTVCVGDVFSLGKARVEVSQPRQPCQTLARRFRRRDMMRRVLERHAFGWYFRVLREGWLREGMRFVLEDRPWPQWTVREVERVMRRRREEPEAALRLARCEALPEDWRTTLEAVGAAAPPAS